MTSHHNPRFEALRQIAGLELEGAYEVRSISTLTGAYNVIGRIGANTGDIDALKAVCAAQRLLQENHTVPCERFEAHESLGVLA